MLVYQRVKLHFPLVFLWFSCGFLIFPWVVFGSLQKTTEKYIQGIPNNPWKPSGSHADDHVAMVAEVSATQLAIHTFDLWRLSHPEGPAL